MSFQLIARIALSFFCVAQGIGTALIDLNRTHATNPLWTGHARFHLVWQSCTVFCLSLLEVLLLWAWHPQGAWCFYLAAFLAAVSPLGFLAAFASRRIFAGTLSDPNGIPPIPIRLFGARRVVDANLVTVIAALVFLGLTTWIYGR